MNIPPDEEAKNLPFLTFSGLVRFSYAIIPLARAFCVERHPVQRFFGRAIILSGAA
jgi:hypothetical protein